jgi:hypothetical protein
MIRRRAYLISALGHHPQFAGIPDERERELLIINHELNRRGIMLA